MRHHFVIITWCIFLMLIAILPMQAKARFNRVTPATRHQDTLTMVVTTRRHAGTTQFSILIQARHGYTLSPFHGASVGDYEKGIKFDRWQLPNADPKSSRALASSSNRGGLHYQFAVPNSQLSSSLFTYEDESYLVEHGKIRMMPSADFYWFRCQDFFHRKG